MGEDPLPPVQVEAARALGAMGDTSGKDQVRAAMKTDKWFELPLIAAGVLAELGDPAGYVFFVLPAMVYCLALVPTAVSASPMPAPLVSVQLDLGVLWRNSPVAVFAVFCVGIANGAFGTLAPVYADREGFSLASVTLFASLPLLAGARDAGRPPHDFPPTLA